MSTYSAMLVACTPDALARVMCGGDGSEVVEEEEEKNGRDSMCSRPADMPWMKRRLGAWPGESGTRNMLSRTVVLDQVSGGMLAGSWDQNAFGCFVPAMKVEGRWVTEVKGIVFRMRWTRWSARGKVMRRCSSGT